MSASAALASATPVLLAALGGLVSRWASMTNLALEGEMLAGGFAGAWTGTHTGSWALALGAAVAVGALVGLVHAILCVQLDADGTVSGVGIDLATLGLTSYLLATGGDLRARVSIPALQTALGPLDALTLIGIGLVAVTALCLSHTPLGLRLRAVEESPATAEAAGVRVGLVRSLCLVAGGALAALGGASLSLGLEGSFHDNQAAGRGFLALAVVALARGRALVLLPAALLVGAGYALSDRLADGGLGADLAGVAPYALALVALAAFARPSAEARR